MALGNFGEAGAGQLSLSDDPQLLFRPPTPATLDTGDDLHSDQRPLVFAALLRVPLESEASAHGRKVVAAGWIPKNRAATQEEFRIMQEARWEAERRQQAEIEAANRSAEEADRRADEAMVVPFMRRLGRLRAEAQKSHVTGQNPLTRSHETNSRGSLPSRSNHDPGATAQARGMEPKPAATTAA